MAATSRSRGGYNSKMLSFARLRDPWGSHNRASFTRSLGCNSAFRDTSKD